MPLTSIGKRVLAKFRERYGKDAEARFYSAMNSGTLSATKMERKGGAIRKRQAKEKD